MVREDDAEEIAVRAFRAAAAARRRNARGRRRAVMAVGDIERAHGLEGTCKLADRAAVGNHPELVHDVVVGRHGHVRIALGGALQQPVDLRGVRIGHHHRAGLGVERLDLAHAVGFLGRRGEFVPADAPVLVTGERHHAGEAGLAPALPGGAIGVVVLARITHDDALGDHALEVLGGFRIDGVRGGIGIRRQIDLGLGDVQEAPRLAARALARLGTGERVIGRCDHVTAARRHGAQRTEGTNERDRLSPALLGTCFGCRICNVQRRARSGLRARVAAVRQTRPVCSPADRAERSGRHAPRTRRPRP